MRKIALLGGILVAAIFGLTGAAWVTTQASSRLSQVQAAVVQQAGLTLTTASTHASIWPYPAIVLSDAVISAPNGLPLLAVSELRLRTGWLGMLSTSTAIQDVALVAPRFNLLIDRQGQANWQAAAPMLLALPVKIENGTVAFLDERSGQAIQAGSIVANIATPEAGSLSLQGFGVWNRQRFELKSYVKSIGRLMQDGSPADIVFSAPTLAMSFNGRMLTTKGFSAAGTVDAEIPDLRALLRWMGATVAEGRGLAGISISGAVDVSAKEVAIVEAKVTMDGMTARGNVGFEGSGPAPSIKASLDTDRLDLDLYRPQADAPLSFAALQGLDTSLDIKAARITHGGAELGPGRLESTIRSGRLEASLRNLQFFKGNGTAHVVLDGAAKTPSVTVEFTGDRLDLPQFLSHFTPFAMAAGTGNVSLSLAAAGATPEEMISTLKGFARIEAANGILPGLDATKTVDAATKEVVTGWGGPGSRTPFEILSMSFTLVDGLATLTELALNSAGLRVSATGEVDLLRKAIDLKINPERANADGTFSGLPVSIIAKGPWDTPKIYPDMPGILENPEAAFAALKQLSLPQPSEGAN